jgi:hypothetical protein
MCDKETKKCKKDKKTKSRKKKVCCCKKCTKCSKNKIKQKRHCHVDEKINENGDIIFDLFVDDKHISQITVNNNDNDIKQNVRRKDIMINIDRNDDGVDDIDIDIFNDGNVLIRVDKDGDGVDDVAIAIDSKNVVVSDNKDNNSCFDLCDSCPNTNCHANGCFCP